jgi:hypothetical protein
LLIAGEIGTIWLSISLWSKTAVECEAGNMSTGVLSSSSLSREDGVNNLSGVAKQKKIELNFYLAKETHLYAYLHYKGMSGNSKFPGQGCLATS